MAKAKYIEKLKKTYPHSTLIVEKIKFVDSVTQKPQNNHVFLSVKDKTGKRILPLKEIPVGTAENSLDLVNEDYYITIKEIGASNHHIVLISLKDMVVKESDLFTPDKFRNAGRSQIAMESPDTNVFHIEFKNHIVLRCTECTEKLKAAYRVAFGFSPMWASPANLDIYVTQLYNIVDGKLVFDDMQIYLLHGDKKVLFTGTMNEK